MSELYIAGFDGSHASRAAVRFAERLAGSTGAAAIAATVHHGHRAEAAGLLATLGAGPVRCEPVAAASPAAGLCRLAAERGAALLVVGRAGAGSVADQLLADAPCPVVVVPSAYGAPAHRTVTIALHGGTGVLPALRAAQDLAVGLRGRLVTVDGAHARAA